MESDLIVQNIGEVTHFLGNATRNNEAVMILTTEKRAYLNLNTGEHCEVKYTHG